MNKKPIRKPNDALLKYLAKAPRGEAKRVAQCLKVSPSMLSQIATGRTKCNEERAVLIEQETGVSRKTFFPESWPRIWPELAKRAA